MSIKRDPWLERPFQTVREESFDSEALLARQKFFPAILMAEYVGACMRSPSLVQPLTSNAFAGFVSIDRCQVDFGC